MFGFQDSSKNAPTWEELRLRMVLEQIEHRGIRGIRDSRVLEAMRKVERHWFVPAGYRDRAYDDEPLPIGEGQTISQPYVVALMTSLAEVDEKSKVLEIGTGCGYQAAVLAEICGQVHSVEVLEGLANKARALLGELGYANVQIRVGDGHEGWPDHAPFDAIVVTCAPRKVPENLLEQLAENGRMVVPVGGGFSQDLVVITKTREGTTQRSVLPVRFVPMVRNEHFKRML